MNLKDPYPVILASSLLSLCITKKMCIWQTWRPQQEGERAAVALRRLQLAPRVRGH